MSREKWVVVALLLLAFALRTIALTEIPPGMTHDEADHGLDAWGVVQGERPLYFDTAYGREPVFDYATAVLMASLGPTYLAGRLTAVFFSLVLLAGTFAWARAAFDGRVALLTIAGQIVGFWPLMTARHALRTVTMPALFVLAVTAWWYATLRSRPATGSRRLWRYLPAGLLLGATFYTYMPARILWFLLPATWLYWAIFQPAQARRTWHGTAVTLGIAAAVAAPMFIYLQITGAEARLDQLRGPIDAALRGEWTPLWRNIRGGLQIWTIAGESGPISWRYNLPGRPLLAPVMGWLFYGGLILAAWRALSAGRRGSGTGSDSADRQRSAAAIALIWFIGGAMPALITGPDASVTRAIGALPVAYLFPALAIDSAWRWTLDPRRRTQDMPDAPARTGALRSLTPMVVVFLYTAVLLESASAYFITWANHPDVRVQYEASLVATMAYLNTHDVAGPVAISTASPDQYHDPSTGLMTLTNPDVALRWFNGSGGLVLPPGPAWVSFTGWAPLNPALAPFMTSAERVAELPLRPDDLNRPVTVYRFDGAAIAADLLTSVFEPTGTFRFGEHVTLLGTMLPPPVVRPGETVTVATLWEAQRPLPDAVLFVHLAPSAATAPIAQADRLDVPGAFWVPGDRFVQLHTFTVPADAPAGDYVLLTGVYTPVGDGGTRRLPVQRDGAGGDAVVLSEIRLAP